MNRGKGRANGCSTCFEGRFILFARGDDGFARPGLDMKLVSWRRNPSRGAHCKR